VTGSLIMEHAFQFSCPSCGALLQAVLKDNLTSVQCGECLDVFDVQKPASQPAGSAIAPTISAAGDRTNVDSQKRRRTDDAWEQFEERVPSGGMPVSVTAMADDELAMNLDSSLQSCTAHRDRILNMLASEPENQNLLDLRDQLTNAINQLQGTRNMVQRAQGGRQAGLGMLPGLDGFREKSHSSRKNKPQRCSICGGIGHKSRTCTIALQQQAHQQNHSGVRWAGGAPTVLPQPQQGGQTHMQWTGAGPACIPAQIGDVAQMLLPVPTQGGYVITTQNGQQQLMQSGPPAMPQGGMLMHSVPMGGQPIMASSSMGEPIHQAASAAEVVVLPSSTPAADLSSVERDGAGEPVQREDGKKDSVIEKRVEVAADGV